MYIKGALKDSLWILTNRGGHSLCLWTLFTVCRVTYLPAWPGQLRSGLSNLKDERRLPLTCSLTKSTKCTTKNSADLAQIWCCLWKEVSVCLFAFALSVFCMVLRFLTENADMAKHRWFRFSCWRCLRHHYFLWHLTYAQRFKYTADLIFSFLSKS